MSDRAIKFMLWLIALCGVWDLGRSYVVTNSLMLFATGGIIPGTNKTLTPNQTFFCMAIFLIIAVLLIFSTNLRRALSRLVSPKNAGEEADAGDYFVQSEQKTREPKPIVVVAQPKRPGKFAEAVRRQVRRFNALVAQLAKAVQTRFPIFATVCLRLWQRGLALAHRIQQGLAGTVKQAGRMGHTLFVRVSIVVVLQAMRMRRTAEPYIRIVDDWLSRQYASGVTQIRSNENVKTLIRLSHETDKVVMGWREDARTALSRVFEK